MSSGSGLAAQGITAQQYRGRKEAAATSETRHQQGFNPQGLGIHISMSAKLGPHTIKENKIHNKFSRLKASNQIHRLLQLAYEYILRSRMRLSSIFLY